MRWHLRNHNCKQVLLGISHDAGCAPFLDEVVMQDDRCRITIIEGTPTVPELAATGLHILNFDNIFRAERLVDHRTSIHMDPRDIHRSSPASRRLSCYSQKRHRQNPHTSSRPSQASLGSWSPRSRSPYHSQCRRNLLDKIKRRTTTNKLCNNHYLRGRCAKGDECCFEHQYKATEEDVKAIAYLARFNPCLNGQDCELEFVLWTHHCQSVIMGSKGRNRLYCFWVSILEGG